MSSGPAKPSTARTASAADVLDIDQAIALLQTTRPTFYRWLKQGRIKAMKAGRQWRFYRGDVERFLRGESPRVELTADIRPLLTNLDALLNEAGAKPDEGPLTTPATRDAELSRVVQNILRLAVAMRASDVHLDDSSDARGAHRTGGQLRFRLDGVLKPIASFDARLLLPIITRFKTLAGCDVNETHRPQDGRIVANTVGVSVDARACFLPTRSGEAMTLRMLIAGMLAFDLEALGFSDADRKRIDSALRQPWGLIVVTGPAVSGKTTTLYSCLNRLRRPETKVMTVEDPIEAALPGVVQVPVSPAAGAAFAPVLRAILRSDADALLCGEVRDEETMRLLGMIALTGHLVLTALHTDEAVTALRRMLDLTPTPAAVADATKLIVAQRLVRKLCPECSKQEQPTPDVLATCQRLARAGGLDWDSLPNHFRAATGCPKCHHTGYRGRTLLAETLEITPELAAALRRGATTDELRALAVSQGMTTMAADGFRRAAKGETTISEILRIFSAV